MTWFSLGKFRKKTPEEGRLEDATTIIERIIQQDTEMLLILTSALRKIRDGEAEPKVIAGHALEELVIKINERNHKE